MKLRNLLLFALVFVSIISIIINAFILSSLTNKNFNSYIEDMYNQNINDLYEYAKEVLENDSNINVNQISVTLNSFLDDPITGINIYDSDGILLVSVNSSSHYNGGMMGNMMGQAYDQIEKFDIISNGSKIGTINIEIKSINNTSYISAGFKSSLFRNSIYSILVAIIIATIIGIFISKKVSKSLKNTAKIATGIQIGEETIEKPSTIKEVQAIRDSLSELSTRLKLKQRSRKTLIDELVHQTRTPLAVLKSHIEAIEDGLIVADKEELSICSQQVDNISSIISNMSSLIDAQKEIDDIFIEEIDIHSTFKQIINGIKPQFNSKKIKLDLLTNDTFKIKTDKYKLNQAIYNILTNSYKYTDENGQVFINYFKSDNELTIEISDNGIGIDNDELEKIFQAYYRGSNTHISKGDGIGLYIVKENIEKLGGFVLVESKKGKGSTFTLKLPI